MVAQITLASGQLGFYDEISNIRLTPSNPTRSIAYGTNTLGLKKAVEEGKIILLNGTLDTIIRHHVSKARPVYERTIKKEDSAEIQTEVKQEVKQVVEQSKQVFEKKETVEVEKDKKNKNFSFDSKKNGKK